MMTEVTAPVLAGHDCWNRIGVWRRSSEPCPRLEHVVHCYNCEVYSAAGKQLLDRPQPSGYVQEWTDLLAREQASSAATDRSSVIFRIGDEWLALPTHLFQEVTEMRPIHRIPHHDDRLLRGIVNIRGETHLCFSLGRLMSIPKGSDSQQATGLKAHARLVVLVKDSQTYVFPASEVHGVHRYYADAIRPAPSTIARATSAFVAGILPWKDRVVGCLDGALVLQALQGCL